MRIYKRQDTLEITLGTWPLEPVRPVPSDMINITGNAGKWYPQSRDHFKKSCCQPCAHAGCLISPCQRSRKWPQRPYMEPPKQLLTIACLALEAIICVLGCATPVSFKILRHSILWVLVFCFIVTTQTEREREMNRWEFDTYTRPMWYS
jgi:hypothetical protein